MKVLVRLFLGFVLLLCPAIMTGCGSSYVSEESTEAEIADEEAAEAAEVAQEEAEQGGSEEEAETE